jgi:hypothetical protein
VTISTSLKVVGHRTEKAGFTAGGKKGHEFRWEKVVGRNLCTFLVMQQSRPTKSKCTSVKVGAGSFYF